MSSEEKTRPKTAHEVMRDTLLAKLRQSWDRAEMESDRFGKL